MTTNGFKLNLKFEECKGCNQRSSYLECNMCEKCKRCNNQRRDYLNEFLVCNSCCKQMEQMTPSGFKPNFKIEECKGCNRKEDYLNEFLFCNSCHEQMTTNGFKQNFRFEKCKG